MSHKLDFVYDSCHVCLHHYCNDRLWFCYVDLKNPLSLVPDIFCNGVFHVQMPIHVFQN